MEEIVTSFEVFKRTFEQLMNSYKTLTDTKENLIFQSTQNAFKVLQKSVDEVGPVAPYVPPYVQPYVPPPFKVEMDFSILPSDINDKTLCLHGWMGC